MAYTFYENYIDNIAQSATQDYLDAHQYAIDYIWENSSLLRTIQGQTKLGIFNFSNEDLLVDYVTEPKTGEKFGDDYRQITYKNIAQNQLPPNVIPESQFLVSSQDGMEVYQFTTSDGLPFYVQQPSKRWLGKYYNFDGYYWLTINTGSFVGTSIYAILGRCNNTLKWIDSQGLYHSWPCIFKRTLSNTPLNYGKQDEGVPQIKADTLIQVQRNDFTNSIKINQRFLFDGQAFQVNEINNHVSDTYMELYCFATQVQPDDDVVNNIAGAEGLVVPESNAVIISPLLAKIQQGQIQQFDVFDYVNGTPTNEQFTITASGPIEGVNYKLTVIDGNHFSIENLAMSNQVLVVTCVGNESQITTTMMITLGGLW